MAASPRHPATPSGVPAEPGAGSSEEPAPGGAKHLRDSPASSGSTAQSSPPVGAAAAGRGGLWGLAGAALSPCPVW